MAGGTRDGSQGHDFSFLMISDEVQCSRRKRKENGTSLVITPKAEKIAIMVENNVMGSMKSRKTCPLAMLVTVGQLIKQKN